MWDEKAAVREFQGEIAPPSRRLSAAAVAIALGAIVLCYGIALNAPSLGLLHDDGLYAVTSKALSLDRGYRIISLPEEIWQTKSPPLFPLALSLVWRIVPSFPDNTMILKLVPFAAALAWLYLVYILVRRETKSRVWAWAITLFTAASPQVLFYSTTLMTETLFASLVCAGMILIRSCDEEAPGWRRLAMAAMVCAAAFQTRVLGATLGIAGTIAIWRSRGRGTAVRFAILSAILMAPWILWTAWMRSDIDPSYVYYTGSNYFNVLFRNDWSDKLEMIGRTSLTLLISPGWLMGLTVPFLLPVGLGVLTILGYISDARRGMNVIHLFILIYLGTVTMWTWAPMRYVVPILPFLILFLGKSIQMTASRFEQAIRPTVFASVITGVALVVGWMLVGTTYRTIKWGVVCPESVCAANWAEVRETLAQVQESTPPDAVLAGNLDPLLYLYTGRKSIRVFEQDPNLLYYHVGDNASKSECEDLDKRARETGADYLVSLPVATSSELHLKGLIQETQRSCPGALQIVNTGSSCCLYRLLLEPNQERATTLANPRPLLPDSTYAGGF